MSAFQVTIFSYIVNFIFLLIGFNLQPVYDLPYGSFTLAAVLALFTTGSALLVCFILRAIIDSAKNSEKKYMLKNALASIPLYLFHLLILCMIGATPSYDRGFFVMIFFPFAGTASLFIFYSPPPVSDED